MRASILALLAILPAAALADPVPVECRAGAPTVCLAPDPDAPRAVAILTLPVGAADEAPRSLREALGR